MTAKDAFARSSTARVWREVQDLTHQLEVVLARLERIEGKPDTPRLRRCGYCGTWALGPVCREHVDLLSTADLLEEVLSA